jgi:hypothetical protein
VPAPGDPGYDAFYAKYTNDPLNFGIADTTPWLPPGSPPPHNDGVAPLNQAPSVLHLPPVTTPSGCG